MSNEAITAILSREGVAVSVKVSYPKLTTKLSAADLGLSEEDMNANKNLLSLGSKRLLASGHEALKVFSAIEKAISAKIIECSFEFANERYVPMTRYAEVSEFVEQKKQEFATAQVEFLNNYPSLKEAALLEWSEFADKATNNRGELLVRDKFSFMQRIEDAFPEMLKLQSKFAIKDFAKSIQLPEESQMVITSLKNESDLQKARQEALRKATQSLAQESEQFARRAVSQLRTEAAEAFRQLGEKLAAKGKPHQRSMNAARDMLQRIRDMNFVGDSSLDAMIRQFEVEYLSTEAKEYASSDEAIAALEEGISNITRQAEELARGDVSEVIDSFTNAGGGRRKIAV